MSRVAPPRCGYAAAVTAHPPAGFERFGEAGDFLELVGPVYARGEGDERILGLRIEHRHRNAAGAAQGGLLATLVDFALGRAIQVGIDGDGAPVTVSLTTDFLRPVRVGDWVEAHTEVERVAGKLAFADCSLKVDGGEVVRGRAVFAVLS